MTTNNFTARSDEGGYMGQFWAELCGYALYWLTSRSALLVTLLLLAGSTVQV